MDKKTLTLLLVVFVDMVGFGIAIPIIPILVERTGGGVFLVGVIISVFSLFQFLFSPILGRLSEKYGRKPVLILSSFLNSLSYLLIFFSQYLLVLTIARVLAGIGSANISIAQAYIADTSKSHERTKKMALVGAAFGLGFIVGPFLGGIVAEKFGIAVPFIIPAVLSLINTALIYILLPESNVNLQKHVKIEFMNLKVTREVLRPKNIAFLMLLFFFVNFALSLIVGVFPLLGQSKFGWNEAQNGYFFALVGVGAFITQIYFIRLLLKKFDETQLIKIGLVAFAAAISLVGLSPLGWLTLSAGAFSSFGFSLMNINTQSLISF